MKKNLIKYTTAIFVILLFISMTQVFFITKENVTIRFYNFLTTLVTIIATMFYVSSVYLQNTKINKTYSMFLAVCYFLTFHTIYSTYAMDSYQIVFLWTKELIILFVLFATYFLFLVIGKNREGFKMLKVTEVSIYVITLFVAFSTFVNDIVTVKPGLYIYAASFIPLIANAFLVKEEVPERERPEKMIKEPIDISDSYVFANYIDGIKEDYDIKNNLAVILNKEDTHELIIGVYPKEAIRIEHFKVQKIVIRYETLQLKEERHKKDRELDRLSILGVLLKNLGAEAASEELRTKLDEYDDLKVKKVFHIIIYYEQKKEEKYFHLYTKTDPSLFIETLERTLPFPIERI